MTYKTPMGEGRPLPVCATHRDGGGTVPLLIYGSSVGHGSHPTNHLSSGLPGTRLVGWWLSIVLVVGARELDECPAFPCTFYVA